MIHLCGVKLLQAKRHASYGYAPGSQGGRLHRVARVYTAWSTRSTRCVGLWAVWDCYPGRFMSTKRPVLLDEPGDMLRCERCDFDAKTVTPIAGMYVARVDGMVKVGCSSDYRNRVRALKGELVASVAGDFVDETRMLALIGASPVRGREWFAPELENAAVAAMHVAAARVPVIARAS